MAEKLTFRYDAIGDILHIDKRPLHGDQGSRQLENEIVVRFNPDTREVENMEILFFSRRLNQGETLSVRSPATWEWWSSTGASSRARRLQIATSLRSLGRPSLLAIVDEGCQPHIEG